MKQYNVISLSLNHLPDKGSAYGDYKTLCEKQSALAMDEITGWYNGCQTLSGARLYNPRSVVCALEDGACQSYWIRTGKLDEVLFFLKYNMGEVRDDDFGYAAELFLS